MRSRPPDRIASVRKILSRSHPHLEQVSHGRRTAVVAAHAEGVDMAHLRRHAARWMKRQGKVHTHLIDAPSPRAAHHHDAEIVHVRHRRTSPRHPAHPAKVVVVSHAQCRVIGEQG